MDTVTAKVYCGAVEDQPEYNQTKVSFHAVTGESGENKSFSTATPSLNLQMWISNDAPASGFFEPHKMYYLVFNKAE